MGLRYLVLSLLFLSSCQIHKGNTVVYDEGGRVDVYEQRANTPRRICGTAMSAATIYLRTGCVCPDSLLVFHKPTVTGSDLPLDKAELYWARRIASNYPPEIAEWYLSNWRKTRDMTGLEAIQKGARQCLDQ